MPVWVDSMCCVRICFIRVRSLCWRLTGFYRRTCVVARIVCGCMYAMCITPFAGFLSRVPFVAPHSCEPIYQLMPWRFRISDVHRGLPSILAVIACARSNMVVRVLDAFAISYTSKQLPAIEFAAQGSVFNEQRVDRASCATLPCSIHIAPNCIRCQSRNTHKCDNLVLPILAPKVKPHVLPKGRSDAAKSVDKSVDNSVAKRVAKIAANLCGRACIVNNVVYTHPPILGQASV